MARRKSGGKRENRKRKKRSFSAAKAQLIDDDTRVARAETEVFADLTTLCASPGYIHALCFLIFRDSVVTGGDEFKKEDFQKLYNPERLIRTEISTLVGLWLKSDRSTTLPNAATIQSMIEKSDDLLAELHEAMLAPAQADFIAAVQARSEGETVDSPLGRTSMMREAIFYSGESAFSFQYSALAKQRYANDEFWLTTSRGIDIASSSGIMERWVDYASNRIFDELQNLRAKSMSEWSLLPIFSFSVDELAIATGLGKDTAQSFLDAFSVPDSANNARYTDAFAFNEASALPFVKLPNNTYIMLQEYVATEALYNSPSYWMRDDPGYSAKAAENRGRFTEELTLELGRRLISAEPQAH